MLRMDDDLVLDGGNAERSEFPIGLRDEYPTRWPCPVRSAVNTRREISEVSVKVSRVLHPRHLVDTDSGLLLQAEERCAESLGVDVVQKRRQLLISGSDFSRSCIIGYDLIGLPAADRRRAPGSRRPNERSPGSRVRGASVRAWGL